MKFCYLSHKIYSDWLSLLQSYKKYVTADATVLEIGSSTVARTRDLSRLCHRMIGVELFPDRKPDDFDNVTYLSGDWQNLSKCITPESIDIAVSSHVIEHVPDDLKAIDELYTVLKSGGVAVLNTPNRTRLIRSVIEFFTGERKFPMGEHQREYTEKDMLQLLDASRFRKYRVIPIVFGIHGGPVHLYSESVPHYFRKFAGFLEIHLFKE